MKRPKGDRKMTGAEECENIGKVVRKDYEKIKKRALEFEKKNNGMILVIPCSGDAGWCELGDNSALIYKYKVCQRLGATVNFADDGGSYYTQFAIGKVRTRGFDTVRRRIKKADLYAGEINKDRCVIFKLNKTYDDDEMKQMFHLEHEHQEKINNIVKTDVVYPEVYREICLIFERFRKSIFYNMDKAPKNIIGECVYQKIVEIIRFYYKMSDLTIKKDNKSEYWQKIRDNAKDILIDLQIMAEQKIAKPDACAEIGAKLQGVIKTAEKYLK